MITELSPRVSSSGADDEQTYQPADSSNADAMIGSAVDLADESTWSPELRARVDRVLSFIRRAPTVRRPAGQPARLVWDQCIGCRQYEGSVIVLANGYPIAECSAAYDSRGDEREPCSDETLERFIFEHDEIESDGQGDETAADEFDAGMATSWAELAAVGVNEPLIDGVLLSDSLVWLVGSPGVGKGLTVLDIVGRVVNGIPFGGHAIPRARSVVYVAAERGKTFTERARAWERHYGRSIGLDRTDGPRLHFRPKRVAPNSAEWTALARYCARVDAGLIVLDTQAAFIDEVNEITSQGMAPWLRALAELREISGACVLVLTHPAQGGRRPRGHGSQDGAADTLLYLGARAKSAGGGLELTCEKHNLAPKFAPVVLAIKSVDESAVIVSGQVTAISDRTNQHLSDNQRSLLTAWLTAFGKKEIELHHLRELGVLGRTTTLNVVKALVIKGLVDEMDNGVGKVYRLAGEVK